MLRILASAVMVLQLQAFGAPAPMALPGHSGHACGETVVAHTDIHVDSNLDCLDCEMPGCESMPGCSGLTAFAAPAAKADIMYGVARAGETDPVAHADQDRGPPILPPPRA